MGSLRSSLAGSREGDEDDDNDEEALMLSEWVGGVHDGRLCSDGTWTPFVSPSFSSLPPSPDKGSLEGESEGLPDSPGVELFETTAPSCLARLKPLPCLEEIKGKKELY